MNRDNRVTSQYKLWSRCLSVYNKAKAPKEPSLTVDSRPLNEGEIIVPFFVNKRKLAGFITFTKITESTAFLNCCYVLPELQGNGIATFLLKQLITLFPTILVRTGNPTAYELYKKLGMYVQFKPYKNVRLDNVPTEDNDNDSTEVPSISER
ncbi:GNAT family N-acetyltransferase [Klebsiella aerogenes]|uniref:GNAT family N-acetyltransferase n=1 Tax=Klebsiella aerogenes TaxID=548 RepID=UPI0037902C87